MKLNFILVVALATVASSHSDPRNVHAGIPQLVGGRTFLSELKARAALSGLLATQEYRLRNEERSIEERQTSDGQSGPGLGSCTNCCSAEGWCGTGSEYCAAPNCQFKYGPGCDANQVPAGASTASIARPVLGSVLYGGPRIYDCAVSGDVAFTFNYGPYIYTSDVLDKLKAYNANATFVITGNNLRKGPIASTTQWATLIRPPCSSCDKTCEVRLETLGYHITYFDLDIAGYLNDSPTDIERLKNIWDAAIKGANSKTGNFLEIEHDIHYQIVYNLTDYILSSMYKNGYKSVTVGDCLAKVLRMGIAALRISGVALPRTTAVRIVKKALGLVHSSENGRS